MASILSGNDLFFLKKSIAARKNDSKMPKVKKVYIIF
jgi:hypothetical protein